METLDLGNILDDSQIESLLANEFTPESDDNPAEEEGLENGDILDDEGFIPGEVIPTDDEEKSSTEINGSFYTSLSEALINDGVFQNIEDIASIDSPEKFKEAIEMQIQARLDSTTKRVHEALSYGVEPDQIQYYESVLNTVNSISEDSLKEETPEAESLRKNVIYQDYINRGFSPERAEREVNKSIQAGTDIQDAIDSLQSNKEFFHGSYQALLEQKKEEERMRQEYDRQKLESLQKAFEKTNWNGIEVDKKVRETAYANMSVPKYRTEDGEQLTEIQKFQRENPELYMTSVAVLYSLTDGFKDFSKIINKQVNKKVKSSIASLEETISGGNKSTQGNIRFASGTGGNILSKGGWKIDI